MECWISSELCDLMNSLIEDSDLRTSRSESALLMSLEVITVWLCLTLFEADETASLTIKLLPILLLATLDATC